MGFWPCRLWPTNPVTPGRVADAVPALVVHLAAHEEVAGEDLLLDGLLATVLELVDLFHGDDDLVDLVLHVHALDASSEVGRDLLLVARLGVHDVPLARAGPGVVDRIDVLVGSASSAVSASADRSKLASTWSSAVESARR